MTMAPQRTLGALAARGAMVTMGGQGLRIVLQVLSVVVLARLLTPHDYGLLAMIVAVIGVAEIFRDFGLSAAAIQAKDLSRAQRSNLFWINTCIGLTLGLVTFVAAPLLAAFYGEPELTDMTRVMALIFVVNGLATQYRADLNRRLRFLGLATADVVSPLIALLTGIGLALLGAGYWALVAQQLTQVAVMFAMVVVTARWLPARPRRGVEMDGLLRFGWNLVGTQLIGYASNNLSSVIIGTQFGAGQLGYYNRGFQLLMTPLNQLRAPTTTVALPVLARLQDDPRFGIFVQRGQLALGYTLVSALAVISGAALPVTQVFLGAQWTEVEPILRLLAIAGIFQTLAYVGYWVYLARGLTRDLFQYTWISASIKVACVLVGSNWGVVGVAAGYALAPALAWPLSFWWLSRRAAVEVRFLFLGAARILSVAVAAGAAAWSVSALLADAPPVAALLGGGGAGLAAYLVLGWAVRPIRRDLLAVVDTVRRSLRRTSAP